MEIMENNQVELLEIKNSKSQIKSTVSSIIIRQYQTKERISEIEEEIKEILHANNYKEKMNTYYGNIKEHWDMIKRQNLRIHGWKNELKYKLKV
jgi:phosphoglycerate-specific signal transduction histidine kinase